jgi:hypothetical protein
MSFFLKIMFLPMMIKVLSKTRRPFVCALLYTLLIFTNGLMFDLAFGGTWRHVGIECAKAFGATALYFWLLNELEGADGPYWLVFALGLLGILFF